MKQYTFKDGTKVIASSVKEAKAKHKAVAFKDSENLEYRLNKLQDEIKTFLHAIDTVLKLLDKFEDGKKCVYQYSSDFSSEEASFSLRIRRLKDNEVQNYMYALKKGLSSTLRQYKLIGLNVKDIPDVLKDIENFLK